MTPLRSRMIAELKLKGRGESTIRCYVVRHDDLGGGSTVSLISTCNSCGFDEISGEPSTRETATGNPTKEQEDSKS